jgi:hypothetical protein
MLKVLEVALAEEGYLEKASNTMLDDKTGNAGSANFTKYARDLDNLGNFYNGNKNGYAWCDVFVDWCFVQAYGVEKAKLLLCQPSNSMGAGCTYSAQYYKNNGQFYTSGPKIGDQIFFGNTNESTHTGLIYAVDSTRIYTIEGNTSGASGVIPNGGGVCRKSYLLGYNGIYGYGRPNYALVNENSTNTTIVATTITATATSTTVSTSTTKVINVTLNELQRGDESEQVKAMQILLSGRGYSVGKDGCDGEFGNNTYLALMAFQGKNGLTKDGICGANTWNKLLKG